MVRSLQRKGLQLLRVRGTNHYLAKDELRTSDPVPGDRPLKFGTRRSILRDNQLSPTEFASLFNR